MCIRDRYTAKKKKITESSYDSVDENSYYIFGEEKYNDSKEGEGWIICASCKTWAYEVCSDVDEEEDCILCNFCLHL